MLAILSSKATLVYVVNSQLFYIIRYFLFGLIISGFSCPLQVLR